MKLNILYMLKNELTTKICQKKGEHQLMATPAEINFKAKNMKQNSWKISWTAKKTKQVLVKSNVAVRYNKISQGETEVSKVHAIPVKRYCVHELQTS